MELEGPSKGNTFPASRRKIGNGSLLPIKVQTPNNVDIESTKVRQPI